MLVFVVRNPKTGCVWVFTDHADALRCRREQKLSQEHLWGCTTNCYQFQR